MATDSAHFGSQKPLTTASTVAFEKRLREDWEWGMNEASIFFEGKGRVQETLQRITRKLNELNIPYAVAGGMALYFHGHERFTEDVDILVSRDGLRAIHEHLDGRGFVRPFEASKNLRDAQTGVRVEFLLMGDYPGDGKPKDVSFPDPAVVAQEFHGVKFLNLPTFITLKLASGMTGSGRRKDLADVEELIKSIGLKPDFAAQLHPYVQSTFRAICEPLSTATRFLARARHRSPDQLSAMLRDGVVQESSGRLVTTDPAIAEKYGMCPEAEFSED